MPGRQVEPYYDFGNDLASSWVRIDGENKPILSVIARDNGLQRLQSILAEMNLNPLIRSDAELNTFLSTLPESNRLAGLEWLKSSWQASKDARAFQSLSHYSRAIRDAAPILASLDKENRQYFVDKLLEPAARERIKSYLQENI